jgi:Cu-Zn family superoxide dismutase
VGLLLVVSASASPSMGRSSRERSPFTEFDVPDPHSSRISCLSGLLGIFVVLCVGLVALLIAQSRSRQESGAPLFAMAAVVGAGTSGTVHLYQHDAGVLIDGTITGLAPHSRHGLSIQTYSGGNGVIFNPFHARHSCPEDGKRRVGDLGNVEADDHGVAHYHRLDRLISLRGTQSIAGRMLVLHASADDCLSQPSGNAGQGIANGPLVVGDPDSNEAQLLSRCRSRPIAALLPFPHPPTRSLPPPPPQRQQPSTSPRPRADGQPTDPPDQSTSAHSTTHNTPTRSYWK